MAEITAAAVKDLRERSGAGMMDCKKALAETGGDVEAAVDWLRAKGLAAAQKKSSRTAAEGLVAVAVDGTRGVAVEGPSGVAVEVNSETDFVAKNEQFQGFARTAADVALKGAIGDAETLKAAPHPAGGTIEDALVSNVATIGENQQLRRVKFVSVPQGLVIDYMHNAVEPGASLGKIGVLVALESAAPAETLKELGKQIAMHIAAAFPVALKAEDIPAEILERERKVAGEKAVAEAAKDGKEIPEHILVKRLDGAVAKFAKEQALLSQIFVMDNKTPIAEVVAKAAKEIGTPIALTDYVRFQLGEGIEKEEKDFAAEVAAAVGA